MRKSWVYHGEWSPSGSYQYSRSPSGEYWRSSSGFPLGFALGKSLMGPSIFSVGTHWVLCPYIVWFDKIGPLAGVSIFHLKLIFSGVWKRLIWILPGKLTLDPAAVCGSCRKILVIFDYKVNIQETTFLWKNYTYTVLGINKSMWGLGCSIPNTWMEVGLVWCRTGCLWHP